MRGAFLVCGLVAVLAAGPAVVRANAPEKKADPPKPTPVTWAHIEIKVAYPEGARTPGLFGDITESLPEAIARLEKAADDEKLTGLVLEIKDPSLGWARLNDLRQAIDRVQAKGKKVVASIDSATSLDYLLAISCDEVIMPESGMLMLLGLRAEVTFYKNLFDKLDVKAEMLRVGEYKSAAEPYTRTEMSPAFREEMESILDDYYDQVVDSIAEARKLDRKKVEEIIDNGPYSSTAAKELGLVDHVGYADELEGRLKNGDDSAELKVTRNYGKKKVDTDFSGFAGMVKLMNLLMGVETTTRASSQNKIAVIYASGAITTGRSGSSLFGGETLGSDTLVKAIEKAGKDDKVKAIVLRVDSPGGSALASDLIWRALEKVNKPVVASMGDVAASGGYYISMGADTIYAEPGTLTGSIGVVGGKVALKGLFEKAGITTTVLSRGKNSGTMSMLDGYTESERTAMQKMLNEIYAQFTRKAAAGRKMDYEKLEKLARGRVYTGRQALEKGLVDKLGTLEDAFAHAQELAGLKADDKVERMVLPKPASPLEALFGPLDPNAESRSAAAVVSSLRAVSPELVEHLEAATLVNLLAREPRLTLLPFRLTVK